jgi:hypothetical protein
MGSLVHDFLKEVTIGGEVLLLARIRNERERKRERERDRGGDI